MADKPGSGGQAHRFGGDWTSTKLEILGKYLDAYTTALQDKPTAERPFRKAYIDAFAGTGYRTMSRTGSELRDDDPVANLALPDLAEPAPQQLLDGSARIALKVEPGFAAERILLMAQGSGIEWTESTWNPVTGCNKISPGCKHCYAERMAERLHAMGQPNYRNGFRLTLQPQTLELPLQWKRPQTIFVNSMSDLFHKNVPLDYIQRVFDVMRRAHWHRFQVLTKRADRLAALDPELEWPANVWMGVSVENTDYLDRIDDLRRTRAVVKFLSLEPLLGPLPDLDLRGIDWAIVGGESGPGARAMDPRWVTDIRDQCVAARVAFFFKQWGGTNKKRAGRALDGRTWDEMPLSLPVSP